MPQMTFEAAVAQWQSLKRQISSLAEQEMILRLHVFSAAFKTPVEGINLLTMADGAKLKATYPINRKVDGALWLPVRAELIAKGVLADDIVKYHPELSIGTYKKLPADIRRKVDRAITAKPGTPSLKVE
jgi:hypothetical protein